MTATSDVAVIGAGIIGLSTAYHLRLLGYSVTVYEAGTPGSGQSTGQSRIFRHAHDDLRLAELAVRARHGWDQWSAELGTPLISTEGSVALGDSVPRRRDVLKQAGVGVETLDAQSLREIIPALAPFTGHAMLDPGGGAIDIRSAITGLADRVDDDLVREQVIGIHARADSVSVRTATHHGEHAVVVLAAGRGTKALARGVGLTLPVDLGAHVRVSFGVRDPALRLPTLQDGSGYFGASGIYAAAYPDKAFYGVGLSDTVDAHDDGAIDDASRLQDYADAAADYVRVALPGIDPMPREIVHCWVTTLPWGDDGMAIWRDGPVAAVAGHNLFKHAPVIGEALGATVQDGTAPEVFAPESRLGRAD